MDARDYVDANIDYKRWAQLCVEYEAEQERMAMAPMPEMPIEVTEEMPDDGEF